MIEENRQALWQTRLLRPGWGKDALRPADVGEGLCDAMMTRKAMLEDANYVKVVPNEFVVEVSEQSYQMHYQPIEQRVQQQWSEKLLEHLTIVNSRLGRKEYAFGGRVRVTVRPASDLTGAQGRILFRVTTAASGKTPPPPASPSSIQPSAVQPAVPGIPQPDTQPTASQTGCLDLEADHRRYTLHPGTTTLGRDPSCDICVDLPVVQEMRLISGRHAYIRFENGAYSLYDGDPAGKPSLNGTFINGHLVPTEGARLQPGDRIQLAAHNTADPRPDAPGVAVFIFTMDRVE